MEATEQNFPVVLFITLYKVVVTFESVYKVIKCERSNQSYRIVVSRGAVTRWLQFLSDPLNKSY